MGEIPEEDEGNESQDGERESMIQQKKKPIPK
jgi:hypothetical protein